MPLYETKTETIAIADNSFKITSLKDKMQFHDPEGLAESLGISSAMWPIFGLVWPSSLVLAKIVNEFNLEEKRILEVGCGIGIASIVASSRNADITASDYHPLTKSFLNENINANNLSPVKYFHADWQHPITNEGKFDLIIGSDLLYETCHAQLLATFINCHLTPEGVVVLIDPGRRTAKKIRKNMESLGFNCTLEKIDEEGIIKKDGYFRKYLFSRVTS